MIIEFLIGAAKAVLGIKSTAATASVVTSGGALVVYGGLLMWFILIASFIKITPETLSRIRKNVIHEQTLI